MGLARVCYVDWQSPSAHSLDLVPTSKHPLCRSSRVSKDMDWFCAYEVPQTALILRKPNVPGLDGAPRQ